MTQGQTWKLKTGLLYAGTKGALAALVGPDEATIFDAQDNPAIKAKFYASLFKTDFEVELCAS